MFFKNHTNFVFYKLLPLIELKKHLTIIYINKNLPKIINLKFLTEVLSMSIRFNLKKFFKFLKKMINFSFAL
jgi:hypothetical protein